MMVTMLQSTNQVETFSAMRAVISAPVGRRDVYGRMLALLTVHVLGTGFLAGTSSAIALRMLGVARQAPLALLDVFSILWVALAANVVSGTLLLIGYPYKGFTNPLFYASCR